MPYRIRKKGTQFEVIGGRSGSHIFGTHETREEARDQQKALYAAQDREADKKKG